MLTSLNNQSLGYKELHWSRALFFFFLYNCYSLRGLGPIIDFTHFYPKGAYAPFSATCPDCPVPPEGCTLSARSLQNPTWVQLFLVTSFSGIMYVSYLFIYSHVWFPLLSLSGYVSKFLCKCLASLVRFCLIYGVFLVCVVHFEVLIVCWVSQVLDVWVFECSGKCYVVWCGCLGSWGSTSESACSVNEGC